MPSVSDFVATAGASLVDAQSGLVEEGTIARMAVSEARLEAKVALNSTSGSLQLETVSLGDITSGVVESSALSTIRLDFVAFTEEPPIVVPTKSRDSVIDEVAGRDDMVALDRIFDGLTYRAEFVDSQSSWLVVARSGDLIVRQAVVEDGG